MRKLIYAINITQDGCCDHTKVVPDDELLEYHTGLVRGMELLMFGRKTYQLMVPYWPDVTQDESATKADRNFAQAFSSKKIVVFSRSLESVDGEGTRIVRSDPAEEIRRLKREAGGDMLLGGVDVASQIIAAGLVDEFRFVVQPILAGEGRRLLDGVKLTESLQLKLVESKFLKSGCVAVHYLKK